MTTATQTPVSTPLPPASSKKRKRDAEEQDDDKVTGMGEPKRPKTFEGWEMDPSPADEAAITHIDQIHVAVHVSGKADPVTVPWSALASVPGSVLERMVSLEWNGGKHPTEIRIENDLWHVFRWILWRLMRKQDLAPTPIGITESDWVAELRHWKFVEDEPAAAAAPPQPEDKPVEQPTSPPLPIGSNAIRDIQTILLTEMRKHPRMADFIVGNIAVLRWTFAWDRIFPTRKPKGPKHLMELYQGTDTPTKGMTLKVPFLTDHLVIAPWLRVNLDSTEEFLMTEFPNCIARLESTPAPTAPANTLLETDGWPASPNGIVDVALCTAKTLVVDVFLHRNNSMAKMYTGRL